MRLASRLVILLLVVAAVVAAREHLLLNAKPRQLTDLAIQQMQADDQAAEALRAADNPKHWLTNDALLLLLLCGAVVALFSSELGCLLRNRRHDRFEGGLWKKGESP
jgi:hypothetical protein